MAIIAIDGACRRNGQPDCVSAGAVLVVSDSNEFSMELVHEFNSTNQRGELFALLKGLEIGLHILNKSPESTLHLITDSEYIFNTINKEWYKNWRNKGWITSTGEPVKNQDLWCRATAMLDMYHNNSYEFVVYHTKGHVIPFGRVTADSLIEEDSTCEKLFRAVAAKFDLELANKPDRFVHAREVFLKNHGFEHTADTLKMLIVYNIVVDLLASYHIASVGINK